MITDEDLAAVIAKLALNFNRTFEDEDAVYGVFDMWQSQLAATLPEDVETALASILADPEVRFFPTIAEFRGRVIRAASDRHRAAHADANPDDPAECITCLDSGWLEAGSDDDGYWFVRPCSQGCRPPLTRRVRRRTFRGRRRGPGEPQQLALVSAETLQAAVADTKRMLGDHDF